MLKSGGVGVKVKGNNAAPDSSTIFRIGSVSKVFAVSLRTQTELSRIDQFCVQVLTLFQMLAQGQIASLDDRLTNYCPGFSMMTEYNITLKQLAAQVSQLNICSLIIINFHSCQY